MPQTIRGAPAGVKGRLIRAIVRIPVGLPILSNENPPFLDSSGTSEIIPSLYLPSGAETWYSNQSREKDGLHEFLY